MLPIFSMFDLPMSIAMGEDKAIERIDLSSIIDLVGDEIPEYLDEPVAIDLVEEISFLEYLDEPMAINLAEEIPFQPLARFAEINMVETRDVAMEGKWKSKNTKQWVATIFMIGNVNLAITFIYL